MILDDDPRLELDPIRGTSGDQRGEIGVGRHTSDRCSVSSPLHRSSGAAAKNSNA